MQEDDKDHEPQNAVPEWDAALSADEEQALGAVRRLPSPPSPEHVRIQARAAFLSGERSAHDASGPQPVRHEAGLGAGSVPQGAVAVRGGARQFRPVRWLAAAAATMAVFVIAWYGSRPAEAWRLVSLRDPEGDLGGRSDRIVGVALEPGALKSPQVGELEFALGRTLQLRLAPCSGVLLPRAPRRWFAPAPRLEVQHGELYGSTAGARLATPIHFVTPELEVELRGTTFAVLRRPDASCVCLLEGSVQVLPRVGDPAVIDLPQGFRCIVYTDGRTHEIAPIDAMERGKLDMMRDAARQAVQP